MPQITVLAMNQEEMPAATLPCYDLHHLLPELFGTYIFRVTQIC